jgi:hypothetical protein
MKGITVDTIMSWGPCESYTRECIEELRKNKCGERELIIAEDILNAPIPDRDKLWTVMRVDFISERQLHEIGIWCWEEIARPIWEKYYPDDKRPHDAIRKKKLWLVGEATAHELSIAAAEAAISVINAVVSSSASWAASVAAAAATIEESVHFVAYAASYAVDWDESANTMETATDKILQHVKGILEEDK